MIAATAPTKSYTTKQMGDACEMLVAAELTLAGIPAMKMPDNWPHYDVVAQREGEDKPICISVKSRTYKAGAHYVGFSVHHKFDWLAIVLLDRDQERTRRIFLIPAKVAREKARKNHPDTKSADERYFSLVEVPEKFAQFENNFHLLLSGAAN